MAENPPKTNLRVLKPAATECSEEIVELLGEALDQAKDSPMRALGLIMIDANRGMWFTWAGQDHTVALLGAMRVLERDIIEEFSSQPPLDTP